MHAIVFTDNEAGISVAKAYAKGLNCENNRQEVSPSNPVFCGKCLSCSVFDSGNHPDTLYVVGSKQKSIGVGDVREQIVFPMAHKPFKYSYKVFIIDKAETLTPAAQNTLLMTIEEPAPYGVFLFVAKDTHSLLPTFLSRSIVIKCDGSSKVIDERLKSFAVELLAKTENADVYDAFMLYKNIAEVTGEELPLLLDAIYTCIGDRVRHEIEAASTSGERWLAAAKAVAKAKAELASNGNKQLALELMLMGLGAKPHLIGGSCK